MKYTQSFDLCHTATLLSLGMTKNYNRKYPLVVSTTEMSMKYNLLVVSTTRISKKCNFPVADDERESI